MSVSYQIKEMLSSTDFARNMNKVADLLKSFGRVVVLRNNNPEMVVLPVDAYERLKEVYDLVEHMEIAQMIDERKSEDTHNLDDVLNEIGLSADDADADV